MLNAMSNGIQVTVATTLVIGVMAIFVHPATLVPPTPATKSLVDQLALFALALALSLATLAVLPQLNFRLELEAQSFATSSGLLAQICVRLC